LPMSSKDKNAATGISCRARMVAVLASKCNA
jgi:hypothetical protein